MTQEHPDTLIETAKIFWRDFAPAWAFPVFSLYSFILFDKLGYPVLLFGLVTLPLFFWIFDRAWRPYVNNRARYWHVAFWGLLVPFIVWVLAVFLKSCFT